MTVRPNLGPEMVGGTRHVVLPLCVASESVKNMDQFYLLILRRLPGLPISDQRNSEKSARSSWLSLSRRWNSAMTAYIRFPGITAKKCHAPYCPQVGTGHANR